MFRNDPAIDGRSALSARIFQLLFPLVFRFQYMSPDVQFATKAIAKPRRVMIPTRHGDVRAIVYSPTAADIEASVASGRSARAPHHARRRVHRPLPPKRGQHRPISRLGGRRLHRRSGVDHGFTHAKPVEVAREAIELIGEHLRKAYA